MTNIIRTSNTSGWVPSMLDGWHPGRRVNESSFGLIIDTSTDKDNDMAFTNRAAAELAREILDDEVKDQLRAQVAEAVATLRQQLTGASCGSVFSFRKEAETGTGHYWYAAIKNGSRWYTTAQDRRVLQNDEEFIEWLIGLEIFDISYKHFTLGPDETPAAIEVRSVDA